MHQQSTRKRVDGPGDSSVRCREIASGRGDRVVLRGRIRINPCRPEFYARGINTVLSTLQAVELFPDEIPQMILIPGALLQLPLLNIHLLLHDLQGAVQGVDDHLAEL